MYITEHVCECICNTLPLLYFIYLCWFSNALYYLSFTDTFCSFMFISYWYALFVICCWEDLHNKRFIVLCNNVQLAIKLNWTELKKKSINSFLCMSWQWNYLGISLDNRVTAEMLNVLPKQAPFTSALSVGCSSAVMCDLMEGGFCTALYHCVNTQVLLG